MNTDPTRDPECCTCPWIERTDPWAQPESWTYYFEQREYDPECPEHGGFPLLEAPPANSHRLEEQRERDPDPCPGCDRDLSLPGAAWP